MPAGGTLAWKAAGWQGRTALSFSSRLLASCTYITEYRKRVWLLVIWFPGRHDLILSLICTFGSELYQPGLVLWLVLWNSNSSYHLSEDRLSAGCFTGFTGQTCSRLILLRHQWRHSHNSPKGALQPCEPTQFGNLPSGVPMGWLPCGSAEWHRKLLWSLSGCNVAVWGCTRVDESCCKSAAPSTPTVPY